MSTSVVAQSLSPVPQALLDLDVKERSNVFPWRGQFSPELVEILLKVYAKEGDVVFDPFAGVGTTLLEAAKQGMRSRGTELNPSAFLMAQSVEWVRYCMRERDRFISIATELMEEVLFDQSEKSPFAEINIQEQAHKLASLHQRQRIRFRSEAYPRKHSNEGSGKWFKFSQGLTSALPDSPKPPCTFYKSQNVSCRRS